MAKRRTTVENDLNERQNKVTWEEAVEQFINSLKLRGLSYHTRRWHKENLQAILKALKEMNYATDPELVTELMVREVVLKMVDKGLSPTTINHRVRSLKQFYKYLLDEFYVTSNPTSRVSVKDIVT